MFYFIGLGLGDAKDITVKGLEIVRAADRVYLEAYTSILTVGKDELEKFYGREVMLADRESVEEYSDILFQNAYTEDIAFLVVGDPFGATTHADLMLRAREEGIPTRVIHNASIMNAVGCCGLQLYKFGETVSICFWTDTWQPDSFYDKIASNREKGMHTLCLLDIKIKEQSIENLMRGRKVYEAPRFMTIAQAAHQLLTIISKMQSTNQHETAFTKDTICVGLTKVGSDEQKILVAPLERLAETDMGPPLHSLVIPGNMHPMEIAMLRSFVLDSTTESKLQEMETFC
ncbi:diphthine methyl ester synthase [Octopus vulgaris]|uniref:Diphthine methyl ester synthase n=2 Tax=Octopus TaxID=6643 RepID=A0AA36BBB2_OCTVU|nr:diphthine methyl ester synthase [Octopus sinensis]CAI9731004.1 diphthine methyl ester synthase [Octopus vulgaris]